MASGFIESGFAKKLTELLQSIKIPKKLSSHQINTKSKFDYVTEFDLFLEKVISRFIESYYPDHEVLSEENVKEVISFKGPTWLIDPLDGTSNFIYGVPFFSSSIGFVLEGQVQFGFVYDFHQQEAFYAEKGRGAFLGQEVLSLENEENSDFIGISSQFISSCFERNVSLIPELRKLGKFRILGSQALALCYVACGRFQAALNLEAKIWDDLAGALIVKEAGGEYVSLKGFDENQITEWNSSDSLFSLATQEGKEHNLRKQLEKMIERKVSLS